MSIEQAARTITREESRGSIALWFTVLGSPLAWGAHLVLNYALEEWFACSPSVTDRGEMLGFSVHDVSLVLNTVIALIAATAGVTGFRCWRRTRSATDGDSLQRARWMAFAGTIEGAIFTTAILFGYLPPLLLDTCATTP
jgi:hypothetical protein